MNQAMACIDVLADVLIDCVEGGASVSFMLPISRRTAVEFWRSVADAVAGGDAERLYERAGWARVGTVPNYAMMPDGAFCGTTFFHKQLDPQATMPRETPDHN
ncbi:hypothetical protein [Trinickia dinghuensis]|uniref:GNAT family N-acetyltransferase n=1 Tax=Trinickia dinghuensis TaxID=2291023 RepID=A0A3D8JWP9_9BURK|nr:hypothetical protein [Trinickia dinghuensis]RDU97507.1 hypothetical protein DWV00_16595 [Trinickia dinghuensis]